MGIEDIKKKILEDATLRKEEILIEAEKKAEDIKKEGARTAENRREAILFKAHEEAQEEHHRMLTMERLEARKLLLKEKQEAIEKAFDESLEKLAHHPNYESVMETMLLKTAIGKGELLLSPRDRSRLGESFLKKINEKLKGNITLSEKTREMAGGFILQTPEVEVNESFEERIRALRDEIEADVAHMLFAG